jgi:ATP-binding cassette subfamily B protein
MSVPALLSLTVLLLRMGVSVALLATVHPLLLLLPVFAVPSLVAGAKAERIRLLGMEERQQHWRRVYDLQRMVVRAAPAKEVRVFGLGPELLRRHRSESDEIAAWERSHRLQGGPSSSWATWGRSPSSPRPSPPVGSACVTWC